MGPTFLSKACMQYENCRELMAANIPLQNGLCLAIANDKIAKTMNKTK